MSRNAPNSQDMEKGFSGSFGSMKDFGFSGSIGGDKAKSGSGEKPPMPRPKPDRGSGVDGFSQGHTNPIQGQEGFGSKMPANGGFAEGGTVAIHIHPHGQNVHHIEPAMDGSVIHHHEHGGYTTFHQDGNITHHAADGQDAVGTDANTYADGGSVNAHPHGHAVTHTERMADREVHRHSHGGFTVHYDDGRAPTHHGEDGTPAYHGGGDDAGMARGGVAHMPSMRPHAAKAAKAHKPKAPKATPAGGALSKAMPVNRPPRRPESSPSPRNEMPAGVMPYGVQPSAEPDVSQGSAPPGSPGVGAPAMRRGGKAKEDA